MKALLFITFLLFTMQVKASVFPIYRDIKPASQIMLEKQDFGTPIAAGTANVLSAFAGTATTSATKTASTFVAQPDVPRNLVITPGGTTTDVESCVIVVNGTNYFGKAISENFTFAADANTAQTGAKAFKTVTSVVFPVDCESGSFGATWSVGFGEKIGLKRCMDFAGFWAWSTVAGVYETTRATIAASASAIESNTADFNGTMNGTSRFYGFFTQNFQCLP